MAQLPLDWKGLDIASEQASFVEYFDIAQKHDQFGKVRQQTYASLGQMKGKGIDVGCGLIFMYRIHYQWSAHLIIIE